MEREDGVGFFQLELSGDGNDRIVEFGLPDVVWTEDVFAEVERCLLSAGFSPRVEHTTACAKVRHFMSVPSSGTGLEAAAGIQRLLRVAAQALGWGTGGRFTVRIERRLSLVSLP